MKRLLSLLLLISLIPIIPIAGAAQDNTNNTALYELQNFHILDEGSALDAEQEITRAEYLKMVISMMGLSDTDSGNGQQLYHDVPVTHWAFQYISWGTQLNLVSGYGDQTFQPEQAIHWNEAVSILVKALGYDVVAKQAGSYPAGYMQTAATMGLFKSVEVRDAMLQRGEAVQLIYNALDVEIMEITTENGQTVYKTENGNTYRNRLMYHNGEELIKAQGQITANEYTWLVAPNSSIKKGILEIDGVLYRLPEQSPIFEVGSMVDFYYYIDEATGENVINQIKQSKEVQIKRVSAKNLSKLDDFSMYDYTQDERKEKIVLSEYTIVTKNYRKLSPWTIDDILNTQSGNIIFIDNNDDYVYDVVNIQEYESFVVERVNQEAIIFKPQMLYHGKNSFSVQEEDLRDVIEIMDKDGESMDVEQIEHGMVVSIMESEDSAVKRVIVSDMQVEGTLQEITDKDVLLDETCYEIEGEIAEIVTEEIGTAIVAYCNFEGRIVYMEPVDDSGWNYAAILEWSDPHGLSAKQQLKLVLAGNLTDETEVDHEAENEADAETPALGAKNKEVVVKDLASTVRIDGAGYKGAEILRKIEEMSSFNMQQSNDNRVYIKFSENTAGEINQLQTPEKIGLGAIRNYNIYEKTFGGNNQEAFGIGDKTTVICLPKMGGLRPVEDLDYLVKVQMAIQGQSYEVEGFDYNPKTKCCDLIVIHDYMDYTLPGTISLSKSSLGIVKKVSQAINADGDACLQITLITDNEEKTFETSVDTSNAGDFQNIRVHDLIYFSLDGEKRINGYLSLSNNMGLETIFGDINNEDFKSYGGYVKEIEYEMVSRELNKWVNRLTLTESVSDTFSKNFEAGKNSPPPVFLLDGDTVAAATFEDINLDDHLFIHYTNTGTVKAIVIIES